MPGSAGAAVLFDLDGVIVDSREHHLSAWTAFAREHAPHAAADYFHRTFGLRNDAIIGGLIEDIEPERLAELAARKEEIFRRSARGNLMLLPGVNELLDFLDEQAVAKAVVTSTPRANLDMILATLGIGARFEALVAEEDASRGKPDPEGFLVASQRVEVAPSQCVVIEDAPAGLQAAKAAGMRAIGVTTTRPAADLGDADLVVESLAEEIVRTFVFQR
ncbi:MAG: HAD family phosphatase [Dehalococcoidia bacterium]